MTPSVEGSPTKAKEALSSHEIKLALLDTNPVFQCLRVSLFTSEHDPLVNQEQSRLASEPGTYSGPWYISEPQYIQSQRHIQNLRHIQNPDIFRTLAYFFFCNIIYTRHEN